MEFPEEDPSQEPTGFDAYRQTYRTLRLMFDTKWSVDKQPGWADLCMQAGFFPGEQWVLNYNHQWLDALWQEAVVDGEINPNRLMEPLRACPGLFIRAVQPFHEKMIREVLGMSGEVAER